MRAVSIIILLGFLVPFTAFSQGEAAAPAEESEMATVYLYRGGQFFGSGINYAIFADGEKICKLSNNKFIEYKTNPGKVEFMAKRGGVEVLKKQTGLDLDMEAGQSYYIRCDVKSSITRTRLEMSEVTANTANRDMEGMEVDKCMEDN